MMNEWMEKESDDGQ